MQQSGKMMIKELDRNNNTESPDMNKAATVEKSTGKRSAGIDYIKTIAIFMVITIHNISRLKMFDTISSVDFRVFLLVMLKFLTLSAVPLFLMATGYLQNKKVDCSRHYKGIRIILASYILNAILCAAGKYLIDPNFTLQDAVLSIFNFTANDYAWYVEMFIGLFLLIPFLNKGFLQIESIKEKQLCVILLCFLTMLPSVSSIFYGNAEKYSIFPDYWVSLYPFTYYIIGAYTAQHKPKINKWMCLACVAGVLMITACIIKLCSGEFGYAWWVFNSNNALPTLLVSVFIFLMLYDINGLSGRINLIMKSISVSTLDIYLYSFPVELVLYKIFKSLNLLSAVVLVFVFSYIIAKIKSYIFKKFSAK